MTGAPPPATRGVALTRRSARPLVRTGRLGRWIVRLTALYPAALLALSVVHFVAPQRAGLLALSQIFAPHLFALAVLLVPLAFRRDARVLRLLLAGCVVVGTLRFGAGLVSMPPPDVPGARSIAALTWNVESDDPPVDGVIGVLRETSADVVGLQELGPRLAATIETDPGLAARYPHRVLEPQYTSRGMGLLSRYPIVEHAVIENPPLAWARLDLGEGRRVTVVSAHPMPAAIGTGGQALYDPTIRDFDLRWIRGFVEPMLARGESVLMLGDYNVTDREPAYAELTAGLHDPHRDVGLGLGSTWRPGSLAGFPFALLRIDYLLSGPTVIPRSVTTDCTPSGSDHCRVLGVFQLR